MSFAGYLLLLLKGSCLAAEMTLTVAEEGSSVMMHAPAIKNVNLTEWEYIRDSTPQFILQYYADSQLITIYPAYKDRVVFYQNNGSFVLQKLREMDSGIYKATVDLMQDKARMTSLRVIKPLPQPKLLSSSNLAGSLINLTCMLPEGMVADVSWKKDGHPLPPEKCCRLTWKTTMLQIRKAEKSDCGSYSCIINNSVSWKEAALNLTVTGLTPPVRAAQMMTAAALVLAAISAVLFVIQLCQLGKHKLGKEAWKWLMMTILGLLCTSSLLLFAASVIWMQEDGHSAAFILLGLFLVAVIVATALTAVAMAPCRPAVLTHFRSKGWHRVILCITATTLVVNLLFTSLLLHSFHQLHAERGCSEAVDLTIGFIIPAVAALPIPLLLFRCSYKNKREKQQQPDTQEATHSLQATSTSVTRCPLQVSPSPVAAEPHNVTMNI
ncbi:hepatocyte cell adhesion molecule-like isoform X1 [Cygnus atratus]|uniref:hepatocyte cell adhesion molecule-like isoform X1 n=1 Tax=Cygnus atratus TaxID=8868 RepID=UPI0015D5A108|nr:hepatocyte cell adhesion molecule-like isoform X1 [Cygnus atratus]XP_035397299.1 hepatocyte cell adhesion molecule-like isoform X1 [Cygnus atratus]XP_035397300.1 hepatocyte cell adhesion molecule-like isoform X1 [Cygnus atratus]